MSKVNLGYCIVKCSFIFVIFQLQGACNLEMLYIQGKKEVIDFYSQQKQQPSEDFFEKRCLCLLRFLCTLCLLLSMFCFYSFSTRYMCVSSYKQKCFNTRRIKLIQKYNAKKTYKRFPSGSPRLRMPKHKGGTYYCSQRVETFFIEVKNIFLLIAISTCFYSSCSQQS